MNEGGKGRGRERRGEERGGREMKACFLYPIIIAHIPIFSS